MHLSVAFCSVSLPSHKAAPHPNLPDAFSLGKCLCAGRIDFHDLMGGFGKPGSFALDALYVKAMRAR